MGVALVSLLSALGAKRPLLCVVDDAQWLDTSSAQAIAFAARRISRDAVAFLFGARTLTDEVRGLPELTVSGLGDQDARTLLATVLPDRLDDRVVDRLVVETHGNPLALLELPRGLTPSQLAGGFGLPVSVTLAGAIEESYRRRLAKLPLDSRRLLLVAAADPTGDPGIVWRAADEPWDCRRGGGGYRGGRTGRFQRRCRVPPPTCKVRRLQHGHSKEQERSTSCVGGSDR